MTVSLSQYDQTNSRTGQHWEIHMIAYVQNHVNALLHIWLGNLVLNTSFHLNLIVFILLYFLKFYFLRLPLLLLGNWGLNHLCSLYIYLKQEDKSLISLSDISQQIIDSVTVCLIKIGELYQILKKQQQNIKINVANIDVSLTTISNICQN